MMKLLNRGFTLTELILTTAILVFALTGLLMLFINCLILNESNRNLTIAISHAEYAMENIKNAGSIENIRNKINNGDWDLNTNGINNMGLQALTGESITTCCCVPPCTQANPCLGSCPSGTNPLGIYLRVDWQDRNQRARNICLSTLFTNY